MDLVLLLLLYVIWGIYSFWSWCCFPQKKQLNKYVLLFFAADLPQTYREEWLNIFQNDHLDKKHPPKKTASSTMLGFKAIIDQEKYHEMSSTSTALFHIFSPLSMG